MRLEIALLQWEAADLKCASESKVSPRKLKIAISGGTFNPVHDWHLLAAHSAACQYSLDEVHLMVNGDPPHKKDVLNGEIRYEFLKAAIWSNPKFSASRLELDRPGKSYTVDTLRAYHEFYGDNLELYYIIGMDNLESIMKWEGSEEIFQLATILVAPRESRNADAEVIAKVFPANAKFGVVECANSNISSTLIRNHIQRARSVRYLVPESVWIGLRYYGAFQDASVRTEESARAGRIGPGSLARSESWALRYFQHDPVTLRRYRYPWLVRLKHQLGLYGFGAGGDAGIGVGAGLSVGDDAGIDVGAGDVDAVADGLRDGAVAHTVDVATGQLGVSKAS